MAEMCYFFPNYNLEEGTSLVLIGGMNKFEFQMYYFTDI